MSLLVQNALERIAKFVEGQGVDVSCASGFEQAMEVLNRTIEELMYEDRWEGTRASLRFNVSQSVFWTPPCVEQVRSVGIDGSPAPIRPDSWQFLQNGPGEQCVGGPEIRDLGDGYATATDLVEPMHLFAYSDSPEDAGAWIHFNDHCQGVFSGQVPGFTARDGERIQVVYGQGEGAQPAQTTPTRWATTPKSIAKSITRGTVFVGGVLAGKPPLWLATIKPNETTVSYRRYQLMAAGNDTKSILADCDLRFRAAFWRDEVLLIQNLAALQLMVQALAARDSGDMGGYQSLKNSAVSKLNKQLEKKSGGQTHRPNVTIARGGSRILTPTRGGFR